MDRESLKIKTEAQVNERAEITKFIKIDDNNFEVNGFKMIIVKNFREAFDELKFKARFSDVLTKYDYIVGDIAADQLRLKGFYRPENESSNKINSIVTFEDYLYEYINFGAPYFIIENTHPLTSQTDFETMPTNGNRPRRRNNRRERENHKTTNDNKKTGGTVKKRVQPKNNVQVNDKTKKGDGDAKGPKNTTPRRRRKRETTVQRPDIKEVRKPVSENNKLKSVNAGNAVTSKQKNQRKRHFTVRQKDEK